MDISGVLIRFFRMDDYDTVIRLWKQCELPYKQNGRDSREKIETEITKDTALFLVAEKDGNVIGTVLGTHDGRKGWINRLAVEESFRHRGLARLLLQEAEQKLYALGIEIIACLIEEGNDTSMAFFNKSDYIRHHDVFYFSKRKHPGV